MLRRVFSITGFEKVYPHLKILLEALVQQDQNGHVKIDLISRPQHILATIQLTVIFIAV